MNKFHWLCYSTILNGAYCITCLIFPCSNCIGKGSHQLTGNLVTERNDDWKNTKKSVVVFAIQNQNIKTISIQLKKKLNKIVLIFVK